MVGHRAHRGRRLPALPSPAAQADRVTRRALYSAVVNPVSGQGSGNQRVAALAKIVEHLGAELEVVESDGPRRIAATVHRAARSEPQALVLIGGDGTVGEACAAYAEMQPDRCPPLVLVPGGRGNSFYKAALDDAPWQDYVHKVLRSMQVHHLDAARVVETGETWALGSSLGFFHDALQRASTLSGLSGRQLYAAAGGYAAARLQPFSVEVTIDERTVYEGPSVLTGVAGGPFRGGTLHLYPKADLTDGLLDVIVVGDVDQKGFADILAAAARSAHASMPAVHLFQGGSVQLRSTDHMRYEQDGTISRVRGNAVTAEVLPGLLPVAYPG